MSAAGAAAGIGKTSAAALAAITQRLESGERVVLATFGDSITWPCYHTDFRQNYATLVADVLKQAYPRAEIELIHAGNMGSTGRGLAEGRFDKHVLAHQPDLVLIIFGMNDCLGGAAGLEDYDRNLRALIQKTRDQGALPVICTQNEIIYDSADGRIRSALSQYVQRALDVAANEQVPSADCFDQWQPLRNDTAALAERLNDWIHPNLAGHRLFAYSICHALWPKAEPLINRDVRPPLAADSPPPVNCLLPGPAAKQIVRTADGTWLALSGRRRGNELTDLVVSFAGGLTPQWDGFEHVTLVGPAPDAVFDSQGRTITAVCVLPAEEQVLVVFTWNTGVYWCSFDTSAEGWRERLHQPRAWLAHTAEPFVRPTALVNGSQDGVTLLDGFLASDQRPAVLCRVFQLAPTAGWEVVEGAWMNALVHRGGDNDTQIELLGPASVAKTEQESLVSSMVQESAGRLLATLSDHAGQLGFSVRPLP